MFAASAFGEAAVAAVAVFAAPVLGEAGAPPAPAGDVEDAPPTACEGSALFSVPTTSARAVLAAAAAIIVAAEGPCASEGRRFSGRSGSGVAPVVEAVAAGDAGAAGVAGADKTIFSESRAAAAKGLTRKATEQGRCRAQRLLVQTKACHVLPDVGCSLVCRIRVVVILYFFCFRIRVEERDKI